MLARMPLDLRDRNANINRQGTAIINPYSVVTSASEIPEESRFGSPVPNTVINLNVLIMPVTVPSSPKSGAVAAVREINGRNRSSFGFV